MKTDNMRFYVVTNVISNYQELVAAPDKESAEIMYCDYITGYTCTNRAREVKTPTVKLNTHKNGKIELQVNLTNCFKVYDPTRPYCSREAYDMIKELRLTYHNQTNLSDFYQAFVNQGKPLPETFNKYCELTEWGQVR